MALRWTGSTRGTSNKDVSTGSKINVNNGDSEWGKDRVTGLLGHVSKVYFVSWVVI